MSTEKICGNCKNWGECATAIKENTPFCDEADPETPACEEFEPEEPSCSNCNHWDQSDCPGTMCWECKHNSEYPLGHWEPRKEEK